MLIREGKERSPTHDWALAAIMSSVAGALNAAGFEAVGVFSANMTGNVSAAADRIVLGDILAGLAYVAIVVSFVSGAAASSSLIAMGKRRGVETIHAVAVAMEALGLSVLGSTELLGSDGARRPALVFGLSFLLGFQNAIATRISGSKVRTTHVSGMATDVGVGLGTLLDIVVHREDGVEARPVRAGLHLHLGTITFFCVGGMVGVVVHRMLGAGLLFCTSTLLLALSLPYVLGWSRKTSRSGIPPR